MTQATSTAGATLHPAEFAQRRQRLAQHMGPGVAVIPTAPERMRNRDSDYLYRFDSYFWYLTGFAEPQAVLVLIVAEDGSNRCTLFCRERNAERELWDGYRCGPEAAPARYGVDEAQPIEALDSLLPQWLANQPALHYPTGADAQWDARVMGWLNTVRGMSRNGVTAPTRLQDVRNLLDEMRLIKDNHELALMRRSCSIASAAHVRAMRACKSGGREYEIEAELLYEFRRQGAQFPSYWPIVAAGANACVLHYRDNAGPMHDGDLLLIDAGCELDGYASDITRTFPVNGRFSKPQRALYELVLAAQAAAISATRPGVAWEAPHDAAVRVLAAGFIDLGLCQGSLDEVIQTGDYKRFYMHRTGHWLGLDVHDAGEYRQHGAWRALQPGMTLTVEPGCYIRPAPEVPEAFWNIGIRIEDDVLVTAQGCEVLSAEAPKQIDAIEALVGRGN